MNEKQDGGQLEIRMYQLLIVICVAIFIAIALGAFFGSKIGFSDGVESVKITAPDFCSVNRAGAHAEVVCYELKDLPLSDLCEKTSPALRSKIRVFLTP